ncbi:FUSC family protein [Rhodococcus sp. HNM0569]|uniref:FUSC family protein n=1 Tax=Rhodococcus sp. HNM0569 TaxID=2716340 RepID=UPI00146D3F9D|nr:FUSC family protein [Rhodococcus sp. HNM0569]NLU84637.1 FUSC family protein [Rhodococcus sp. HNM0569]
MLHSPVRPDPARLRRSRSALAHAFAPRTWRGAVRVNPADATIAIGVRVGVAVAIVLVVAGLLGYERLGGFAALGALVSAFARHEPYPRMGWKVGLVGAALVVYVLGGALLGVAGVPVAAQIAVMAVAAGVGVWFVSSYAVSGPGPVILIFSASAAVGAAHTATDVAQMTAVTAFGVVVGWLAAMAPWLLFPMGPARLATARALASLGRLEEQCDPADVEAAQASIAKARHTVEHSGRRHRRYGDTLGRLLDDAAALVDRWAHEPDPASARALARHESELRTLMSRRELRGFTGSAPQLTSHSGFLAEHAPRFRLAEIKVAALRTAVAGAVAGWAAYAFGFDHPLWASMGAMATLQGVDYTHTVHRGIQRLLGNVVGAVLAAALIAASLGYWEAVVAVVILQAAAEMLVARNYALTSITVTAMALLLVGFGSPVTPEIAVSRVADTLVGVAIGIVVAALSVAGTDRAVR